MSPERVWWSQEGSLVAVWREKEPTGEWKEKVSQGGKEMVVTACSHDPAWWYGEASAVGAANATLLCRTMGLHDVRPVMVDRAFAAWWKEELDKRRRSERARRKREAPQTLAMPGFADLDQQGREAAIRYGRLDEATVMRGKRSA